MAKLLKLVDGIPQLVSENVLEFFDKTTVVNTEIGVAGATWDAAHEVFLLPDDETFDGSTQELKIEVNGQGMVKDIQYTHGTGSAETSVSFASGWRPPMNAEVRFMKFF
jgi:hypothetical protein